MKKLVVFLALAGLLVGSVAGPADAQSKKKKKAGRTRMERTIEHEYTLGSPGIATGAGVSAGACLASTVEQTGCVNIPLGPGEVFVKVSVADSSGAQPFGILAQDTDESTPASEIFAEFCGETPQPIPVTPGLELRVSLYEVGPSSCPGPTGTGTMTIVLSNLP
ncbi:MAG TPA: hypothetical protein VHJ82_03095 [Actinomycetota bacterium]|nr:hypothetical protein [Actinomycetota bacterium]